jgi:hypothetical protein
VVTHLIHLFALLEMIFSGIRLKETFKTALAPKHTIHQWLT